MLADPYGSCYTQRVVRLLALERLPQQEDQDPKNADGKCRNLQGVESIEKTYGSFVCHRAHR